MFDQRRYWRIPVKMGAILVALQERIGRKTYASEEITCTQNIFHILRLQKCYRSISISIPGLTELGSGGGSDDVGGSSGPPEGGDGAGDDAGPSGGGGRGLGKRKREPSAGSKHSQKPQGRARAGDVEEAGESGSCRESSELTSNIAYFPLSHLDQ
jgi:hypothetical protein